MYSFEQDHTAAARTTTATFDTSYQPCAAGRSLQLSAHRPAGGQQQVLRTAAVSGSGSMSAAAAAAVQPRRATCKSSKKHAAAAASRRSSTTVVATDVNNFRAMVQELTGFPPAAIFRPLPRRVHAASPFVAVSAASGQGCAGREQHGHASWEATNSSSTTAGGGSSSPDDAPAVPPVMLAAQQPQFAPLGVFDGLSDLGSPEFDSWGDLSID
ncbi:uncharacterized protein LOC8075693 [Sorghum bicolor]|uniref:VQ domain-containing protein n=1 Tax=Sorghum bicolor TaxID=4558 RepID=C5XYN5_SORBI|nr:uncharacterized protein LOC8075693 [Sorghum bicolor]EES07230.1 hypothetical protein SORBI_3004G232400 [Sorghum bicolor]|eukprot:XP_002454254.1 uncharacterized protein LOC8075693 [Sorghum bicolor]